MSMQGAVAAGFHIEEPHGEVFGAHFFLDEPSYFHFGCSAFDPFGVDCLIVEYFHQFFTVSCLP